MLLRWMDSSCETYLTPPHTNRGFGCTPNDRFEMMYDGPRQTWNLQHVNKDEHVNKRQWGG